MSGEIFQRDAVLEIAEDVDVIGWNPLMCYLCNGQYEDPCILGCYHSFCSTCLKGKSGDGKMSCPLCKSYTALKEGDSLPPKDKLLHFLVMSSCEEREQCANCDGEEDQMYFCNTCASPLCARCREETHRAKMFSRHDIVVLSKRTKEIHRECSLHHEPFILFSTEKKMMLCINCFRDMKIESRSFCVDMETAYHQSCKKLDQRMQAIRELQNSVRDSILLLRALLEEITQNSELEKSAINDLYNSMLKEMTDKREALLKEVDRQYQDKEKVFTEELASLSTLLPTLHTHLVTCAAFSSSANKFEFLDLAYILMERLKSIIHLQHPLHPSQGSQICTDFKVQIAKCLEPLLFPRRTSTVLSTTAAGSLSLTTASATAPRLEKKLSLPHVRSGTQCQNGRRQLALNKLKLADGKGVFVEHCQEFDSSHKNLSQMVERLKSHLQELQRDLTLRRCLTKQTVMEELQAKVEKVEQQLEDHKAAIEQKQPLLEMYWDECLQRIAGEQEVYQAQLQDVMRIHQETSHLRTILNQLARFVTSITALTVRLAPKLATSNKESHHDHQIAAIFEQINTMEPDSHHRVEAIRTAEEERETLSANRTNPLDEELIKTKGLLRAPSARKNRDSARREVKDTAEGSAYKESSPAPNIAGLSRKDSTKGDARDTTVENIKENDVAGDVVCQDLRKLAEVDQCERPPSTSQETEPSIMEGIKVAVPLVQGERKLSMASQESIFSENCAESMPVCGPSEGNVCSEVSLDVVLDLEPEGLDVSSDESSFILTDSTEHLVSQCGDTYGRSLTVRTDVDCSCESAVCSSGDMPCSKQSLSDVLSDISPKSTDSTGLSRGRLSPMYGGAISPISSDSPDVGAESPGDPSEMESNDDDMTGGESVRARIERLKVSIDNGTCMSLGSRSPKDTICPGSRSPMDTTCQGSRSPMDTTCQGSRSSMDTICQGSRSPMDTTCQDSRSPNDCTSPGSLGDRISLGNSISQQGDVVKSASQQMISDYVSATVGNSDVPQKKDCVSVPTSAVDNVETFQPDQELKLPVPAGTGSQTTGRRRRRVKSDQTDDQNKVRWDSLGEDIKQ